MRPLTKGNVVCVKVSQGCDPGVPGIIPAPPPPMNPGLAAGGAYMGGGAPGLLGSRGVGRGAPGRLGSSGACRGGWRYSPVRREG